MQRLEEGDVFTLSRVYNYMMDGNCSSEARAKILENFTSCVHFPYSHRSRTHVWCGTDGTHALNMYAMYVARINHQVPHGRAVCMERT